MTNFTYPDINQNPTLTVSVSTVQQQLDINLNPSLSVPGSTIQQQLDVNLNPALTVPALLNTVLQWLDINPNPTGFFAIDGNGDFILLGQVSIDLNGDFGIPDIDSYLNTSGDPVLVGS